jgi:hydroxyethylthiazole kinase-like uncharacterized protein yjeF
MSVDVIITREIPPLPRREDDAHKGSVGRIIILGGSADEVSMIGAPALTANAALRGGAGLVQLFVPAAIRDVVASIAPCTTVRTMPADVVGLLRAAEEYQADVAVVGPGLGRTLAPSVIVEFVQRFEGPVVIDADGLNQIALADRFRFDHPERIVMTPHPGEMQRLLVARGLERIAGPTSASRRAAACALVEAYGCNAVLKGRGTVVTNGRRLYVNETGNSGMATAGTGDVLTGLIAALIGQGMVPFEASILSVYLHGLAGDFAAEELGRRSMTTLDLIEFLPDAFCEWENAEAE